ncbi:Acaa1a, partial [Symbiodinium microadriaticum]
MAERKPSGSLCCAAHVCQCEQDRTRSSPLEERKKVFRDLQRQLHPDKNLHDQEAAKLAFQKLMES